MDSMKQFELEEIFNLARQARTLPIEELIERLIADAPVEAKQSFPAQIHFKDGRFVAGQVSRAAFNENDVIKSLYRLHTVAKTKQNGVEEAIMVVMFFAADAVLHLDVPVEQPKIAVPEGAGRIVMPG